MKQKIVRAALLLAFGCCLACAASFPKPQDFAGNWVVDLSASETVNPAVKDREDIREFMSQIVMTIDMEKHELAIKHAEEEKAQSMAFTITKEEPGILYLSVDDGYEKNDVSLELKGGMLTFRVIDDLSNRDSFVFVRAEQ